MSARGWCSHSPSGLRSPKSVTSDNVHVQRICRMEKSFNGPGDHPSPDPNPFDEQKPSNEQSRWSDTRSYSHASSNLSSSLSLSLSPVLSLFVLSPVKAHSNNVNVKKFPPTNPFDANVDGCLVTPTKIRKRSYHSVWQTLNKDTR